MSNILKRQLGWVALLLSFLMPLSGQGQKYYSHTPDGKVYYELSTEQVLLRFKESLPLDQRREVFRKFPLLPAYKADLELDTPRVVLAKLAEGAAAEAIEEMLEQLRRSPGIELANPFLVYRNGKQMSYAGELAVGLKEPAHLALLEAAAAQYSLQIKRADEYTPTIYYLETTSESPGDALAVANLLAASGKFAFAEPNFIRLNLNFTNDPLYYAQWSLENTGNWPNSEEGVDMRVNQAWNITTGSSNIRVAVIDDGVDLYHPDLVPNLVPGYDATGLGGGGQLFHRRSPRDGLCGHHSGPRQ